MASTNMQAQTLVIGSGPGGYSAAFRAADLGQQVVLVERYAEIGGVCLNVGCIPSKALLHAAKVIEDARAMESAGISFGAVQVDKTKLRTWKENVVSRLTKGLKALAKQRKVTIIEGTARFVSPNTVAIEKDGVTQMIDFQNAIIAVGSRSVNLPFIPSDPRIFDSTGALQLSKIDGRMLVLGGGIIGLEMATVYHTLGCAIDIVDVADTLIPACDADVVKPLLKRLTQQCENIYFNTKVVAVEAKKDGIWVTFEGAKAPKKPVCYDQVLVAVGRRSNSDLIDATQAGVQVDDRGFISVDKQMRTNVSHIYAIGDVIGHPMLAHKAVPEGRLAAEVIAGQPHYFDAKVIPSVAYTDPEVAWVGLTEKEAKQQGLDVGVGVFPWAASGRALSHGRDEGLTKLIFDNKTHRLLGAGIVGIHAGDLIGEAALAIEMGCVAEDLALTIHPHPTFSETIAMASEVFEGTATDLYAPKKKKKEGEPA